MSDSRTTLCHPYKEPMTAARLQIWNSDIHSWHYTKQEEMIY